MKDTINNYDDLFICSAGNQNVDVNSEAPDSSMKRLFSQHITGYSDIDVSISQNSFTKSGYLFAGWHIVDDDGFWCVIDEEDGWCDWLDYLPDGYSKKLFNSGECVNYQSDNGCNLNAYAQWVNKEDILIGDVNLDGVVNIIDATTIQKYIAELCSLNEIQLYAADVNKDGRVNIDDVTALQKLLV